MTRASEEREDTEHRIRLNCQIFLTASENPKQNKSWFSCPVCERIPDCKCQVKFRPKPKRRK